MVTLPVDALEAAWQAGEREQDFWSEHYTEYVKAYPDQFVAVRDDRVIATDADLERLVEHLREHGIDPQDVWIQFIASSPQSMML